ncbi:MAG: S1 RNA-binding domain-containing protein [Candidatus Eisenbacteria bacterium]
MTDPKQPNDIAPTPDPEATQSTQATEVNEAPEVAEDADDRPSAEFAEALAAHDQTQPAAAGNKPDAKVGAKVRGKVVSIGEEHVLFDFGGRSEGSAEVRQWRNEDGTLKLAVGDELDLYVVEAGDQVVLATSVRTKDKKAKAKPDLGVLKEASKAGLPVSGRVTGVNTGGLTVDIGGVRGFCPISQIEAGFVADAKVYVGKTLEFVVTKIEEGRSSVVLSRRSLLKRGDDAKAKELLATLKVGDELDGKVARLEAFGAFVDLGGIDGLVHVSEISLARIGHPKEALQEGQSVRVKVLRIENGKDGKQRIALSIRATGPDPWQGVESQFSEGQRVEGTVARLAEFGAFITLAPGIDGLVHVSEVSRTRIGHVKEALTLGQKVEAVVLGVDPEKKRISLSIKQTLPPAEGETERASTPREPRREARGGQSGGQDSSQRGGQSGGRAGAHSGGGAGRPSRGGGGGGGNGPGGPRRDREGGDDWRAHQARQAAQPAGETQMAIALRKAMEKSKAKQDGGK